MTRQIETVRGAPIAPGARAGRAAILAVAVLGAAPALQAEVVTATVTGRLENQRFQNAFQPVAPGYLTWIQPGDTNSAGALLEGPELALPVTGTITFDDADPAGTVTSLVLNQAVSPWPNTPFPDTKTGMRPESQTVDGKALAYSFDPRITFEGFAWQLDGTGLRQLDNGAIVNCIRANSVSGSDPCTPAQRAGVAGAVTDWIQNVTASTNSGWDWSGVPDGYAISGGSVAVPPEPGVTFTFGGVASGSVVTLTVAATTGNLGPVTHTVSRARYVLTIDSIADATPDPFAFTDVPAAPAATLVESDPVTPADFTVGVPVSVTGGEYAIDGGPWVATPGTLQPGQSVRVRVTSGAGLGATVSATLTVGGVTDTFTVTTADFTLTLDKQVTRNGAAVTEASPGDTLVYRLVLANNSVSAAANLQVDDPLPPGILLVSASGPGSYDGGTGLWSLPSLAALGNATLDLTVQVDPSAVPGAIISNTATVTAADAPFPAGASDTVAFTVVPAVFPDAVLTKEVFNAAGQAVSAARAGERLTYRLTVSNNTAGTLAAVVNDDLPAAMAYVGDSGGYDAASGLWSPAAIASGGTAVLTIQADVAAGAAAGTVITNTATFESLDGLAVTPANDPDYQGTATVAVGVPDLALAFTGARGAGGSAISSATLGDAVAYVYTLRNSAQAAADLPGSPILLDITVPAGIGFTELLVSTSSAFTAGQTASVAAPDCTAQAGGYRCSLADVQPQSVLPGLLAPGGAPLYLAVRVAVTAATGTNAVLGLAGSHPAGDAFAGNDAASGTVFLAVPIADALADSGGGGAVSPLLLLVLAGAGAWRRRWRPALLVAPAVLAVLALAPTVAPAATPYLGAGIGIANIELQGNGVDFSGDDQFSAWLAGYEFGPGGADRGLAFALEAGYVDFGRPTETVGSSSVTLAVDGFPALVTASLPIAGPWRAAARAGVIRWESDATSEGFVVAGSEDGVDAAAGLGLTYRPPESSFEARLDASWFDVLDGVWSVGLGLVYRFE